MLSRYERFNPDISEEHILMELEAQERQARRAKEAADRDREAEARLKAKE